MDLDGLDRGAEHLMRRWVLPACFAATCLFCLGLASYAVLDRHWPGAAVLLAVAIGLAWFADRAGRGAQDHTKL